MAEYIEREAIIKLITSRYENPELCTQEINSIPAADVAPVVHGRWENFRGKPRCSQCKAVWPEDYFGHNYCPRCGAKMDGGKA